MKKLVILLLSVVFVTACSASSEEDKQNEQAQEPTFTDEDISLAKEMIQTAQELENEFVTKANKQFKETLEDNPDKYQSETPTAGMDEKKFRQDFMPLSKEKILDPFVEQYREHIVGKEDTEVQSRVNVSHISQKENEGSNGIHKKLEERQLFSTYQNLTLEEPVIESHNEYGVDELVFLVDTDNTVTFIDLPDRERISDRITFYKSEEGDLLIGEFPFLEGNEFVNSFEADAEDVKEDLQQLPKLK